MSPEYRPDQRLVTALPRKPLGARVPAPLHERVERLCEAAYAAGQTRQPSKEEMVAALLLACPTDGTKLRELLNAYGEATVADALPWLTDDQGGVIALPVRKSGPRSGAAGS